MKRQRTIVQRFWAQVDGLTMGFFLPLQAVVFFPDKKIPCFSTEAAPNYRNLRFLEMICFRRPFVAGIFQPTQPANP